MERLAKEKIAAQNRILCLKRELATYDIDYTKLLPESTDISAVKSERVGESESSPTTIACSSNDPTRFRTISGCIWEEQSHVQFNEFALECHDQLNRRVFLKLDIRKLIQKALSKNVSLIRLLVLLLVIEFIAKHRQRAIESWLTATNRHDGQSDGSSFADIEGARRRCRFQSVDQSDQVAVDVAGQARLDAYRDADKQWKSNSCAAES